MFKNILLNNKNILKTTNILLRSNILKPSLFILNNNILNNTQNINKKKFSTNRNFIDPTSPYIGLNEDQTSFYELAYTFAMDEMKPYAQEWDENKTLPINTLRKGAELGFGGLFVDPEYGGTGLGRMDGSIIFEALSTGCTSTTAYITIHNMCAWMLNKYASNELKEKYLPDISSMKKFASYCLTEPGSGSDAASLITKAVLNDEGTHYIINGQKAFISGGDFSDVYLVMCRTGEGVGDISCILIDKDTPGLAFGSQEKKLGWRTQPTCQVMFEDCKVPVENLVGERGFGFKYAMMGLDGGRVNIGTCSVGAAQECFDIAKKYTLERKQFNKRIIDFQNTQFQLAEMAADIVTSRELIRKAANLLDNKDPSASVFCAMAKRVSTDLGFKVCNQALQLLGGYGYLNDYQIERYLRDVRVHQILEGTNQIMQLIISRNIIADLENKYN